MTVLVRRAVGVVAASALLVGAVACGGSQEKAGREDSAVSDGGGIAASDAGGVAALGEGDATTAAPSDGGGDRITVDIDEAFPKPDPADYPGMNTRTAQGAEATTRYFWAMLFWAGFSGDFSEVEGMYTDGCGSCLEVVENGKQGFRSKHYQTPSRLELMVIGSAPVEGYEFQVDYGFHESPTTAERTGQGVIFRTSQGMVWDGDRWLVDDLGVRVHDAES